MALKTPNNELLKRAKNNGEYNPHYSFDHNLF